MIEFYPIDVLSLLVHVQRIIDEFLYEVSILDYFLISFVFVVFEGVESQIKLSLGAL